MQKKEQKSQKKFGKNLEIQNFAVSLHRNSDQGYCKREFSSVGLEHLPYKQRVGGSTPSTPTNEKSLKTSDFFFYFIYFAIKFLLTEKIGSL